MRVMCNAMLVLCNDTNTGCHSLISYIFGPRNFTVESVLNHWWLWLGYRQHCCEVYSLFISLALWTLCKFGWSVAMIHWVPFKTQDKLLPVSAQFYPVFIFLLVAQWMSKQQSFCVKAESPRHICSNGNLFANCNYHHLVAFRMQV